MDSTQNTGEQAIRQAVQSTRRVTVKHWIETSGFRLDTRTMVRLAALRVMRINRAQRFTVEDVARQLARLFTIERFPHLYTEKVRDEMGREVSTRSRNLTRPAIEVLRNEHRHGTKKRRRYSLKEETLARLDELLAREAPRPLEGMRFPLHSTRKKARSPH